MEQRKVCGHVPVCCVLVKGPGVDTRSNPETCQLHLEPTSHTLEERQDGWTGLKRKQQHRWGKKACNDFCCHSHDFWTALVTHTVLPRRWRIVSLVMHHKCNTKWGCCSHTCGGEGICASIKENVLPITMQKEKKKSTVRQDL